MAKEKTRGSPGGRGASGAPGARRAKSADGRDPLPDGDPASIVRRAPFADSPFVGERGQRAQIRILEAALEVFGEVGYHDCGVKRITELSGYSRASFYQYFSSKEDLFRHLAGRVAKQLNESSDALPAVTADLDGWQAFHAWLGRYSAIYDAYEPVFVTFQTAVVSDAMVASGASVVATRTFNDLRSKIVGSPLPATQIDTVVRTLLQTVARLNRESELLEQAAPRGALTRDRANIAFADTFHRALFGPDAAVNIHASTKRVKPLPRAELAPAAAPDDPAHGPAAQRTRTLLLEAGHRVFVERGYYATRVADIVNAAGVSHGVFYRYFDNKAALFRLLADQASRHLSQALDGFPSLLPAAGGNGADELRAWLRGFASTYAAEASIFTMWSEAISRDELGGVSAAVIDGSRARLAGYLEARGWGDAGADGLVLLVFLDAMAAAAPGPHRHDGPDDRAGPAHRPGGPGQGEGHDLHPRRQSRARGEGEGADGQGRPPLA